MVCLYSQKDTECRIMDGGTVHQELWCLALFISLTLTFGDAVITRANRAQ